MKKPNLTPRIIVLLLTAILLSLTTYAQADLSPNDPRSSCMQNSNASVGSGVDVRPDDYPANPQDPSAYNVEEADDSSTPSNPPKIPQPQKPTIPDNTFNSTVNSTSHTIDAEPFRITLERRYGSLLSYGIKITARDGATYYESADQGGSGRHGTANNIYTEKMYVAGFAIVERSSGRLVMSHCFDRASVPSYRPAPIRFQEYDSINADLFIAACTDGFTTGEIGWFRAEDLTARLPDNNVDDGSGPKDPLATPLPAKPDYDEYRGIVIDNEHRERIDISSTTGS